MKRANILKEIYKERSRQDKKWGANREQSDEHWFTILAEEFGEIAECVCKTKVPPISEKDKEFYTKELPKEIIQTCAVLVAWLESKNL
jgi:hypothetical protein